MRWLVLLTFIACLIVATSCANDDVTANWVLNAVNGMNHTSGGATSPESNPGTSRPKLNLTPTRLETAVDCTTRDNKSGLCVSYYLCDTNTTTIIEDGTGLLDLRTTKKCPHYLDVCCKIKDVRNVDTNQMKEEDSDASNSPNRNKDQESVPAIPFTTSTPIVAATQKPINPNIPECGWSNPGVSPFVFRESETRKTYRHALHGDFPWMIALLKKSDNSDVWSQGDYLGGGTLIHPSVVMTVAHKLLTRDKNYTANELRCRAGEWDTQTDLELYRHQDRNVVKIITHEEYYRTSLYNDIGLLILEKPFQLKNAPHIGTGCLANSLPPPGRVCYSMGWGRVDPENKKEFANILKKVLLNTVEANTCQQMLRDNSRLGELFDLHESLTCANGNTGEDSCRGDGGAPLVCAVSNDKSETRFAVHGMVAYGIKCFDPKVPGVYANTVFLKSWIDAKMQQEGLDPTFYTI